MIAVICLRIIFIDSLINAVAAALERALSWLKKTISRVKRRSHVGNSSERRPFTEKHPRLQRFLRRGQDNRAIHSIMTLLVDIQEAQCFFLIGVQIAVLVATTQPADFHGTFTIWSLRETRRANRQLAHTAITSICLFQITLHRVKMGSAYTLFLSLYATVVGTIAREVGYGTDQMGVTLSSIGTLAQVSACGQMGSLRVQCLGQTRFYGFNMVRNWVIVEQAVYLLGFAILLYDKVSQEAVGQHLGRLISQRLAYPRSRKFAAGLFRVVLVLVEAYLLVAICRTLNNLYDEINPTDGGTIVDGQRVLDQGGKPIWNIGQALAILIWAPVLFKFIYILIRGVEEGFRVRLSSACSVRRRDESCEAGDPPRDRLEQRGSAQEMYELQLPSSSTSSKVGDLQRLRPVERRSATA